MRAPQFLATSYAFVGDLEKSLDYRRQATCRPAALVQGEVGLALPIRLASTDDSLSYGARGNHGRIVREKVAQRYGFDLDLD